MVSSEVEIAVRKDKKAWKGLRAIQRRIAGLRPVRPNAIKYLDGKQRPCLDSTLQHWHQHFSIVLNVRNSFDINAIDEV